MSSEKVLARLLIVDDLGDLASAENYCAFRAAGYELEIAGSTTRALEILRGLPPDLILLEASLAQRAGYRLSSFIQSLRGIPVILVGELESLEAKLAGLAAGADDFVSSSGDLRELRMRVWVLLRRWLKQPDRKKRIQVDQLVVDPSTRKVFLAQQPIELGEREFDVLHYLAKNPTRIIHRNELLNRVWNLPTPGAANLVPPLINALRAKLKGHGKELIQTFRGQGYRLGTPPARST